MRRPGSSAESTGLLAALAAISLIAATVPAAPVFAQVPSAADKTIVDGAKAKGDVGEQSDGYLGFVHGAPDAAVGSAVGKINAGRAAAYRDIAAKNGVSPEAAGAAAAQQLIARVPAGQYYQDTDGRWVKR
jgi:uncharacterized protein YdbL (DUF1318 family)